MEIKIVVEDGKLRKMSKLIAKYPKAALPAVRSALNDTGRAAWTATSKRIREVWNIKAGHSTLKSSGGTGLKDVVRAKNASYSHLQYSLTFSKSTIPLMFFDAKDLRKSKAGVSYRLKKTGSRGRIKSAFIATSRNRHRPYVLVRKSKERYPLRPLTSVSTVYMMQSTKADEVFIDTARKIFPKEYYRNLKYYMSKYGFKI